MDAIVTDPPYYDNVMYAECSDYFYVWLKRALRDTWPEFTDLSDREGRRGSRQSRHCSRTSPFRQAVERRRQSRQDAQQNWLMSTTKICSAVVPGSIRVLKPDGVLTVMFTHKRVDAWDTLGAALLDAGFSISASWPVHTESRASLHQAKKNAAASTIFLACRKRTEQRASILG